MVAMLEGALLMAPHWAIGVSALLFLVALNAAAYGSALALRDQLDKAREATDAAARVGNSPAPTTTPPVVALAKAAEPEVNAPESDESPHVSLVQTRASQPKPRALPAPAASSLGTEEGELFARAIEVTKRCASLSTESLRRELNVRQPTAAALISRLEREGWIGQVNPSDRGRRPVLARAESA